MQNKADYEISSSENEGIAEIAIRGSLTTGSLDELHDEVIAIIRSKNVKAVLCDVRALKGPQELTDAYYRSRSIPPDIMKLPAAVVELPTNLSYQSFFETTAANAGLSVKWFTDVDAARQWLKNQMTK